MQARSAICERFILTLLLVLKTKLPHPIRALQPASFLSNTRSGARRARTGESEK
jgi:hypothetical protein